MTKKERRRHFQEYKGIYSDLQEKKIEADRLEKITTPHSQGEGGSPFHSGCK